MTTASLATLAFAASCAGPALLSLATLYLSRLAVRMPSAMFSSPRTFVALSSALQHRVHDSNGEGEKLIPDG